MLIQRLAPNHRILFFQTVARDSGNRMRKIEKLQAMLADVENLKINFSNFDPLSLPLDPEVKSRQLLECIVLNDIISMYEE